MFQFSRFFFFLLYVLCNTHLLLGFAFWLSLVHLLPHVLFTFGRGLVHLEPPGLVQICCCLLSFCSSRFRVFFFLMGHRFLCGYMSDPCSLASSLINGYGSQRPIKGDIGVNPNQPYDRDYRGFVLFQLRGCSNSLQFCRGYNMA